MANTIHKKKDIKVAAQKVEPIITFSKVDKIFPPAVAALNDINFAVSPGEFLSVIGASGAGKSTLFKLIIRQELPTAGGIFVFGENVSEIPARRLPYFRRKIGVVFQDYKLLPAKTVYENISFVLEAADYSNADIKSYVPKVLELVGLLDKANAFPDELAGGQQQRVSIARAIVKSPKILIADEPTGNLDPKNALDILELLTKINALGTTVLLTTHNKDLVNALGKRVITLDNGRVVRDLEGGRYFI